jgi:hypothetical protein
MAHNSLAPLLSGSELQADPRWQLVQRIVRTAPFQKSSHLPALLVYLAKNTTNGHLNALTERHIGTAVFGKPAGYSPAEDSAVRVHVRHLRLRLHEFYACEGRLETLIIDIPKGSYTLEFRTLAPGPKLPAATDPVDVPESLPTPGPDVPESLPTPGPVAVPNPQALPQVSGKTRIEFRNLLVAALALIAAGCGFGWYRAALPGRAQVPWPLNSVVDSSRETKVVVADTNTMLRLLRNRKLNLEDYLQSNFLDSMVPPSSDQNVGRLVHYISDAQLTSFADLLVCSNVIRLAGSESGQLSIVSSRGLSQRDLEGGNFVFVGGPTSNPWVSLFKDKLNFEVVEDSPGGRMYFLNEKPRPGEDAIYEGLTHTGSSGDDYATISVLPTNSGNGRLMILQGLRQEGTEALGVLLSNEGNRQTLLHALGFEKDPRTPLYFEALVRARAVAGAPISINIVATRIIQP